MPDTKELNDIRLERDLLLFWEHGYNAYMLRIEVEDEPTDPRADCDHVSSMACFHSRYNLGDKHWDSPSDFWASLIKEHVSDKDIVRAAKSGILNMPFGKKKSERSDAEILDEVMDWIENGGPEAAADVVTLVQDDVAILPLWLYDHSGLSMSCGKRSHPYNDPFDSSAIGWITVSKADAVSALGANEENWREKAEECMRSDVDIYDRWLNSDVWIAALYMAPGRREPISGDDDWDEDDVTGGFYGDGLISSGIAEYVGHGLMDALKAGKVRTGHAEARTIVVYTYMEDGHE